MKRKLTKQELLDRYVYSVQTLLPPDKMDDIAAEIKSNLQSLIEDRAMEVGRELRLEEVTAILKQHGHPKAVASRYGDRPERVLIGPGLFPFYWSTLRASFTAWVVVRLVAALAFRRTAPGGSSLLYLSRDIMAGGFLIGAGVTAVFAVWEYLELPFPYPERWKPEYMPPVPPLIRQPARECRTAPSRKDHGRRPGALLSDDGSILARDVLGMESKRDIRPIRDRLRDAAAIVAAGLALDFSDLAELYALC